MILHDREIQLLIEEERMIEPFEPELLNPASLDLRLGENIMVEVEHTPELQLQSIAHCTAENPYWLAPGEFVLAETRETFNMPNDVCGMFCLNLLVRVKVTSTVTQDLPILCGQVAGLL